MSPSVHFTVPGKPVSVNRSGFNCGSFRKRPEATAWQGLIANLGARARRVAGWETTEDPVEVSAVIFFGSERPDTDGPVKLLLDALQAPNVKQRRPGAGLIANDRQVKRLLVVRDLDRMNPRVEVTVTRLNQGGGPWQAAEDAEARAWVKAQTEEET